MNRTRGSGRQHCHGAWVWNHHHGSIRSQMTRSISGQLKKFPNPAGGMNTKPRKHGIFLRAWLLHSIRLRCLVPLPAPQSGRGSQRDVDQREPDGIPLAGGIRRPPRSGLYALPDSTRHPEAPVLCHRQCVRSDRAKPRRVVTFNVIASPIHRTGSAKTSLVIPSQGVSGSVDHASSGVRG